MSITNSQNICDNAITSCSKIQKILVTKFQLQNFSFSYRKLDKKNDKKKNNRIEINLTQPSSRALLDIYKKKLS